MILAPMPLRDILVGWVAVIVFAGWLAVLWAPIAAVAFLTYLLAGAA